MAELSDRDGQTLYELCVRLLMLRKMSMTRQAISKHLAILEAAMLMRVERSGRQKLHYLNPEPISKIRGALKSLVETGRPQE